MQSKTHSIVESLTNVLVGYFINLVVQMLLFPLCGIQIPLSSNIQIGAVFTVISIARSYALRRLFNRHHQPPAKP